MKKYILFSIIAVSLLGTVKAQVPVPATVESAIKKEGKYAILAQVSRHFIGAVKLGADLKKNHPDLQFVVGMSGDVVKELVDDKDLRKHIDIAQKHGVTLIVCESAMHRFQVKKTDYHTHIQTTPNVYRYMFGLQEIGFKILSL